MFKAIITSNTERSQAELTVMLTGSSDSAPQKGGTQQPTAASDPVSTTAASMLLPE